MPHTAYGKLTNKGERMSSTESRISITVKTPAGILVTVRAESPDELDTTVSLAVESLKSAVAELESAAGTARFSAPSGMPSAQATVAAAFPGAKVVDTPPFNPAPIGGGRNCSHGKMKAMQGTSKKDGSIYKGYFCPAAKDATDKCPNIYVQKNSPEWQTFVPEKIV
jgi:hypothetical protein